jgi:murein DD-endopeptidase MepM/ murein hydrolase activator NlpD
MFGRRVSVASAVGALVLALAAWGTPALAEPTQPPTPSSAEAYDEGEQAHDHVEVPLPSEIEPPASRSVAQAGSYSSPEWLPIRRGTVWCTLSNCTYNGAPYHGYWALDLGAAQGEPIYAAGSGQVVWQTSSDGNVGCGGGRTMIIDHGGGVRTVYGHLSQFNVSTGAWVTPSTVIGRVGATGTVSSCTAYHLHFEKQVNGSKVDPGQLKACVSGSTVTFPSRLGYSSWNQVPPHSRSFATDGTACSGSGGVADGDFVSYGGDVYRIAGGAPMYVSSWTPFGGSKPTKTLTSAQFNALADNPKDGTYIAGATSGRVFRIAGGAPQYVSKWSNMGGEKPTIKVDDFTIDRAGGTGKVSYLRAYPRNGTYLKALPTDGVYVVAGGAPIHVSSWANVGGSKTTVGIDKWAIDRAGGTGTAKYLRGYPATGTFLRGYLTGAVYRVVNGGATSGHAFHVKSWDPYGGPKPVVNVDQTSVDNCNHLNCSPFGYLDAASGGTGEFTLRGWAMDPNTTNPVTIHVYSNGKHIATKVARRVRSDLDKAFHRGSAFGYDETVPALSGQHQVCVYGINQGKGSNSRIDDCINVTVTAAAPAAPQAPSARRTKRSAVVSWKEPDRNGALISSYVVKSSTGKTVRVSGDKTRVRVRGLPRSKVQFKVRALNSEGASKFGRWSKKV